MLSEKEFEEDSYVKISIFCFEFFVGIKINGD